MRRALSLAHRGGCAVRPNPRVGCVIVAGDAVVGQGYHRRCGGDHAEVEALRMAGEGAAGATAYVTLEPCSHHGRTPPCAPRLVEAGVSRVVVGTRDPNPRVCGRGNDILRSGGVEVTEGVLASECAWINRGFFHSCRHHRPWVTLKAAATLDGTIALDDGRSQWITGPEARRMAHLLRAEQDALLVGRETVEQDDPSLTVRECAGPSPLPVVLNSRLRITPAKQVYRNPRTVVACSDEAASREDREGFPFEILPLPSDDRGLSIPPLLSALAGRGVQYLLVEGGGEVIGSFLRQRCADAVALFVAPSLLGAGRSLRGGFRCSCLEEKIELLEPRVSSVGRDFLVEGVLSCSPGL
ncbi:MAG: bifunctional diaminohydroxyphosphoribosylaminopyrimidine deaminase/5-amino-6-(5-phosphoribosylamino)uracil reductase RibD [Synergistales bacterium]|nr:bifunctional diaminohydroxyphosphoribosylaminopyrimidine deaminase/5-amino-6-(5-phosphoribosylamino)uracil reductase RibD [Synergistales bacterium]